MRRYLRRSLGTANFISQPFVFKCLERGLPLGAPSFATAALNDIGNSQPAITMMATTSKPRPSIGIYSGADRPRRSANRGEISSGFCAAPVRAPRAQKIRAVNNSPLSQSIDILETASLFGRLASRWRCDGSRDSR
jgi:hypothetical protein